MNLKNSKLEQSQITISFKVNPKFDKKLTKAAKDRMTNKSSIIRKALIAELAT